MGIDSPEYKAAQIELNRQRSIATGLIKLNTHQTAYNEFIVDFVERHGNNQATRDEAHEWADRIVAMARDINRVVVAHVPNSPVAKDAAADFIAALIDDLPICNNEEARYLAACVK